MDQPAAISLAEETSAPNRTVKGKRVDYIVLWALLAALPIFINVGSGVRPGQPNRLIERVATGVDVPLSGFLVPALMLRLLFNPANVRLQKTHPIARIGVSTYIFASVTAYLVGVALVPDKSAMASGMLLAQAMLPLSSFVIGKSVAAGDQTGDRIVRALTVYATTLAAFAALHLAITLASGTDPVTGLEGSFGPYHNSKILRFFPTQCAVGALVLVFALIEPSRLKLGMKPRILYSAGFIATVLVVGLAHSRMGLLILLVGLLILLSSRVSPERRLHVLMMLLMGVIAALAVAASAGGGLKSVERLFKPNESAAQSTELRNRAITDSLEEVATSPLGRMYRAEVNENLDGRELRFTQVAIAENGMAEVGLRAGPIAMGALVAVLVGSFLNLRRQPRSLRRRFLLIVILTSSIASMTQLNFTEAYTAPFTWFIVGYSSSCTLLPRSFEFGQRLNKARRRHDD